ncbi:MAG: LysR family transcriptional regulator, partial [Ideonella sp.]
MLHIRIRPQWQLLGSAASANDPAIDSNALLSLLAAVHETGSLAQAARSLGTSYRHAWGQVQRAQAAFGQALIEGGRGRPSALTPLAQKLIWADKRISAR